jgi:hypothetical protein
MPSPLVSTRSGSATQSGAWTFLLLSSVVYFFSINEADNDLWGHVLFGSQIIAQGAVARVDSYSYTVAGQPWINHEWLSQVVLAAAYRWAGSPGLLLLKFAVATLTFLLLFGMIRRRSATPYIWGGVGLLVIAVLARGFAIRPQIFTYCGTALTLWLIDRYRRGQPHALWFFPVLFLVWANLHGGFILGLGILGFYACATLLRDGRRPWQPWVALSASVAVTALNPYGPRLLLYIWNELSRSHPISEWQPAAPTDVAQFVFFTLVAALVVTLPLRRHWRDEGWEAVLAVGVGALALRHQRHTAVFALCAAAPLAAQLEQTKEWVARRSSFALSVGAQRFVGLGIVALAALQLSLTGMRLRHDGLRVVYDPREYPVAAVRALRDAGTSLNLAVPLDWGEYVLWFLAPQVKVSLDGRFATVFPERVVEDNFAFFSSAPAWRRLLDDYPTEAVLLPADWSSPIRREPGWQRAYGDAVAEVYVRSERAETLHLRARPGAVETGIFP